MVSPGATESHPATCLTCLAAMSWSRKIHFVVIRVRISLTYKTKTHCNKLHPTHLTFYYLNQWWIIVNIRPSWINFSQRWNKIQQFSFKNLKMLSAKWQPFCSAPYVFQQFFPALFPDLPPIYPWCRCFPWCHRSSSSLFLRVWTGLPEYRAETYISSTMAGYPRYLNASQNK